MKIFFDKYFVSTVIADTLLFIDAILFYSIFPGWYFRFGRLIRPVKVILESSEVSKTLMSLYKTIPQIVDVGVLLLLITFIYGIIGNRLLDHEIEGITVSLN
jgi:hypothetical protein